MVVSSKKSFFLFSLITLLVIALSIFVMMGPSKLLEQFRNVFWQQYIKIVPASKKVTIISQATSYRVMPEMNPYAINTINSLNLFGTDKVFTHNKTRVERHTIRELNIIFTDERQFWPAQIKKDNTYISTFDISVDKYGIGTLKIWINPEYTVDPKRVSNTVNLAFFMSLYVISNWETYDKPASGYTDYVDRTLNELSNVPTDSAPLVVIN